MSRPARILLAATAVLAVSAAGPSAAFGAPAPDVEQEYWFSNWDVLALWAQGIQGQGITVAVLDTGVQADKAALAGVVLPGTDFAGGDGRTDTDRPNGHGSTMAMFIAGQGGANRVVGVAPKAKILPVTTNPGGAAADPETLLSKGIDWASSHGAKVISISEGAPAAGFPQLCPPDVAAAVRTAVSRGSVVVAASGNTGDAGNLAQYPASCPGVLAVGAVDGGKHIWPGTQRQAYVDVGAPGVRMHTENADGKLITTTGTSNSAALAAGAIALVWSKFPALTNRQVIARLLATLTDDADRPGRDDQVGYGELRPHVAIRTDVGLNAPNVVFDELATAPPASSTRPPTSVASPGIRPVGRAADGGSSATPVIVGAGIAAAAALGGLLLVGSRRRRHAHRSGS